MLIYLFRHGIAIDRDAAGCPAEPERFLTDVGRARTAAAARGLAALGVTPDAVISSPFVRAVQTAEIAMTELGCTFELELDDALIWSRPPKQIIKRLAGRPERRLMLVGHAPHLDDLADALLDTDGATRMKKASLLEIDGEPTRGGGVLVAYYPPRALRALGGEPGSARK